MTRKQAIALRGLKIQENKAWVAYTRGQPSVARALDIFGKDAFYTAWLAVAAKAADFHLGCMIGR